MKIQSALTATALAALLVLGTDYLSFATTGGSFILGHANSAGQPTSLTNNGSGPALKLNTSHPGTTPALAVNSHIKVPNLNADLVDGVDASQLGVATRLYRAAIDKANAPSFTVTLASVPKGSYLVNANGFIYGSRAAGIRCDLIVDANQTLYDWFDTASSQDWADLNMSGLIRVPATQNLTFTCRTNNTANTNWSTYSAAPLKIALTKITSLTIATPAAARPAAKSLSGGPTR
jgi:hypothetical protein